MRIGRTIPPAASPIYIRDIINGIKGLIRGQKEIERFRSELKEHYGVKHCFLVSSGKRRSPHPGIHMLLGTIGHRPRRPEGKTLRR